MTAVITRKRPRLPEALVRALYLEHGRALLGYALRLTRDYEAAEDVVQETLFRAWRNPESLRSGKGSTRAWLLVTARNLVIDRARAQKRRPQEVSDVMLNPLAAVGDQMNHVLDSMVVNSALEELPSAQRIVVQQVYLEGRSVAEAAAALRVPEGTVKSRCHYALRALRTIVNPVGLSG